MSPTLIGYVFGHKAFHLPVVNDLATAGPIALGYFVDQRPDMKRP
jgi:hypothetical protein